MRVSQLIDLLSKLDQDAFVRVRVGWAADTAIRRCFDGGGQRRHRGNRWLASQLRH